jgi:SnoaL-like domain
MSEENVELVLEYLRRAEAEDFDVEGVAALMHPEITGTAVRGWPEPGPFVGRDAMLAETKRLTDWGESRFTDIEVVADEGDWVLLAFHGGSRTRLGV